MAYGYFVSSPVPLDVEGWVTLTHVSTVPAVVVRVRVSFVISWIHSNCPASPDGVVKVGLKLIPTGPRANTGPGKKMPTDPVGGAMLDTVALATLNVAVATGPLALDPPPDIEYWYVTLREFCWDAQ